MTSQQTETNVRIRQPEVLNYPVSNESPGSPESELTKILDQLGDVGKLIEERIKVQAEFDEKQAKDSEGGATKPEESKIQADLKKELQTITELQNNIKNDPRSVKYLDSVKDIVSTTIENNPNVRQLFSIQAAAERAMSGRQSDVDEFKNMVDTYISDLPRPNGEKVDEKTKEAVKQDVFNDTDKGKKGKLGFFKKFIIRIQLIFDPKKDIKWLVGELRDSKNFTDDADIIEYIKDHYKDLLTKETNQSQLDVIKDKYDTKERARLESELQQKKEEELPEAQEDNGLERILSKAKQDADPLAPAKNEKEKAEKSSALQTQPLSSETILQALGKTKEAEKVMEKKSTEGITAIYEMVDSLREGEKTTTPQTRIQIIRRRIISDLYDRNIQYTEVQIDKMFEDFASPLGESEQAIKEEFELSRESVKDIVRARDAQRQTMAEWYSEAENKATKNPNASQAEKEEILRQEFTTKFIDTIIEDHQRQYGPFHDMVSGQEFNIDNKRRILQAAIQSGQIELEFRDGMPVLRVNNPDTTKGKADVAAKSYSSDELMLLINGEDPSTLKNRKAIDGKTPSPRGLYITPKNDPDAHINGKLLPTMIAINVGDINKSTETSKQFEAVLKHEVEHAKYAGLREEERTYRVNRQINSLTEAKWAQFYINSIATPENFDAIITKLRTEDASNPRIAYLERLASNEEARKKEVQTQLASFIKSEFIPKGQETKGDEFYTAILSYEEANKKNTASKFQEFNVKQDPSKLEEFTTNTIDTGLPLTLGDLGFRESDFDINKPEHQTLLGMMRITNLIKDKEDSTTDYNLKSKCEAYRIQIADYFGSAYTGLRPNLGEFRAIINSAIADENHPLHGLLSEILLKDQSADAFLESILNGKITDLENVFDNYPSGLYKATNNKSDLRNTAMRQKDAYYFGSAGYKHRMGGGPFGTKQDIFSPIAWFHQKDKGPGIFQLIHPILGSKKFYMDGLGIGQNKYHIDSNDGLEAISFATGIPFHRMPFMQNFSAWMKEKSGGKIDLNKSEWLPKGIFTAEPSTYLYYTLNVIYGKLRKDHQISNVGLIKLLPELGGYIYDNQGNPDLQASSYTTQSDQYRLNDQLATFIEDEMIYKDKAHTIKREEKRAKKDAKGNIVYDYDKVTGKRIKAQLANESRDDLIKIVDRLRSDKMIVNGEEETVYYKEGRVVTEKLYKAAKSSSIDQVLASDRTGAYANCVVQNGRLRLGQVTQSTIDEIKEIMFIPPNQKPQKARNPWGIDARDEFNNLDEAGKNVEKIKAYEKIAKLMMKENDRRYKEEGKFYTINELYEEMCRAQTEPWPDMYVQEGDHKGEENKEAAQRYSKPIMTIGENFVELNMVKEFVKDFSMARANKVLSVGVWGQKANYEYDKDGNPPPNKINWLLLRDVDDSQLALQVEQMNNQGLIADTATEAEIKALREAGRKLNKLEYKIDLPEGTYGDFWFTEDADGKRTYYFEEKELSYGRTEPVTKSLREVKSLDFVYDKNNKLKIVSKQNNFTLEVDPIKGLERENLRRYFGDATEHELYVKDDSGRVVTKKVNARGSYSTSYYTLYDDVHDEFDKIYKGRELSYRYSLKLNQIGAYREKAKIAKEMWDGFLTIDKSTRFLILSGVLLGAMVPGLAFLANPVLLLGTLGSALTLNPMLARYQKGWAARELKAIEVQNEVIGLSNLFWGLTNENEPPSYGAIDLARSQFEGLKYSHLSILKSFGDAEWDTNTFTGLFKQAWSKVSEKPF